MIKAGKDHIRQKAAAGRAKPARDVIGWREWVTLPQLGSVRVKAKIDTGARTSAIHAFHKEYVRRGGHLYARFAIAPLQRNSHYLVDCEAHIIDSRLIRNSGGHQQRRDIIQTIAELGPHRWTIELSLTSRDEMGFRMLLGRSAVRGEFLVDPGRSFVMGK